MGIAFILKIIQVIVSVSLIALVLIQSKGGGLSSTFGGSFNMYRSKRGAERLIFISTIVLSVLLVVGSLTLINIA